MALPTPEAAPATSATLSFNSIPASPRRFCFHTSRAAAVDIDCSDRRQIRKQAMKKLQQELPLFTSESGHKRLLTGQSHFKHALIQTFSGCGRRVLDLSKAIRF